MHCHPSFRAQSLLLLFLLLGVGRAPLSAQLESYEYRYHTYAESVELLEAWTSARPELAELYSIGSSATGTMELWMVELTNRATGPAEEKPAAYFDGNQHDFAVLRAGMLPRVRIREVEAESLGGERWRVRVRVANEGWLDTSMEKARMAGISRPDELRLLPEEGVSLTTAAEIRIPFMRGTRGSDYESFYYGEWEVTGAPGADLTVEIRSLKGGVDRVPVRLGG